MKNQTNKFDTIIESYINGNISWVRGAVKKLTKEMRKALYRYTKSEGCYASDVTDFFLDLV